MEGQVSKKIPEVEAEMDILKRDVGRVFETLAELEAKLVPVMRTQDPTVEAGEGEKLGPLVPVAGELREQARKARSINTMVKGIVERLEI